MGAFKVPIRIGVHPGEANQEFDALVDTGAINTTLPASVLEELGVARTRRERFWTENGYTDETDMGLARVSINGRETWTWVIFADEGSPVLLGRLTLDQLVLKVDPQSNRLVQAILYR